MNKLTPNYLRELIPFEREVAHDIRNSDRITYPNVHKNYFFQSFIPSTIRLWNNLDQQIKSSPSIDSFKSNTKKIICPNRLYKPHLTGHSRGFIQLSRLRLGLSGLNSHRKSYHFINYSTCPTCNFRIEDNPHYLLKCPTYAAARAEMIIKVSELVPAALRWYNNLTKANTNLLVNLLINGTQNIPAIDNHIFNYVSDFIIKTRRFR